MKKRLAIAAVAIIVCVIYLVNKANDKCVPVKKDDPAMSAAIETAKASSPDFIRAFHAQLPGTKGFYVKKPYPTPSKGVEHMWIAVTAETNGTIYGTIANDAEETTIVKCDDAVSLNVSEISDWKYQSGKKLVGGYTVRYFIDRMSPKEKADLLKEADFEL